MRKNNRKNYRITVRCTDEELERIKKYAEREDMRVSQYVVQAALQGEKTLCSYKKRIVRNGVLMQEEINNIREIILRESVDKASAERLLSTMERRLMETWQS